MFSHAPLIIDVAGVALRPDDQRRLLHPLVGGLILFARNFESRTQLTALCRNIKQLRPDALICVDHEGGRVQRFKTDGFTHLPAMRTLGQLWRNADLGASGEGAQRASQVATACGRVLGAQLRACGVDLSFTPVLDLDWPAPGSGSSRRQAPAAAADPQSQRQRASRSAVIGDRAFDADARVVSVLAKSLMHGLLQSGVANCGKHFPGHGFVRADSHTDIPVDRRSLQSILSDDAAPYRWLANSLCSVMPAHVIYPKVDSRPAGFSSRWLQDILRGQLGFDGAVFSDDLSMAGARRLDGRPVSVTLAAVTALNAGCDLVLLCNRSEGDGAELDALIDGLTEARQAGQWQPRALSEERRRALLPRQDALAWERLMADRSYQHALQLLQALPEQRT